MTHRSGRHAFSGIAPTLLTATVLALAGSGCSSTSLEDAAPVEGAANTGSYPNLNIAPQAAAPQISPEERAAKLAALQAAQRGQTPGAEGETSEQRRKRLKLLADQQKDTLKVIESN